MKIECTVEELKELVQKEKPVAGTTDTKPIIKIGNKVIEYETSPR